MIKLFTNQKSQFLPNPAIWLSNPADLGANLPGGLVLSPVPLQLSKFKAETFDFRIGQIARFTLSVSSFRAALLVHGKAVEAGLLRCYNMVM